MDGLGEFERRLWMDRDGVPEELRAARLVLSETEVRTVRPVPLHGKPDQVFALPDGRLVVVDTKRRGRPEVTWADVIQVSTYCTILAYTDDPVVLGRTVAGFGYIRFVSGGWSRPVWRRIGLLPTAEIVGIWCDYWRREASQRRAVGHPAQELAVRPLNAMKEGALPG